MAIARWTPAVVTLPTGATTPYVLYSTRKLSGWAGSFCRIIRASDSAELDTGFKSNNTPDGAAADTHGAATTFNVNKLYDQSGNGRNLAQTTDANRPKFYSGCTFRGIRPISFCGQAGNTTVHTLLADSTWALDRSGITIYMLISPRMAFTRNWLDFTTDDFATSKLKMYCANGLIVDGGSAVTATAMKTQPGLFSWASGGSGQRKRINGVETTSATTFASAVLARLMMGQIVGGSTAAGAPLDLHFLAVYNATHSSATMQLMEAELTRCFYPVTTQTKRVVYNGSSLIQSHIVDNPNQTAGWLEQFGREMEPDWEIYTVANATGIAVENSAKANYTPYYDATKAKNVYLTEHASNDITGQVFANSGEATAYADTIYTTLLDTVSTMKGVGFAVVVPTIICRGNWNTNTNWYETCRLRYNSNVTGGAVANGYTAADRAGEPLLGTSGAQNNSTYFQADATHLKPAGTALLAAIDKAAVKAA